MAFMRADAELLGHRDMIRAERTPLNMLEQTVPLHLFTYYITFHPSSLSPSMALPFVCLFVICVVGCYVMNEWLNGYEQ
jgi:hypothetical protein